MNMRILIRIFGAFLVLLPCFLDSAGAGTRIYRDSEGVPHVYADSNRELFFGFGYLIGHDRLFQLEMRKRQALGQRAEVLGRTDQPKWPNKFVEKDIESRRGLDLQGLRNQIDRLDKDDLAIFEAYVEGINRAIDEALSNDGAGLPGAFRKYGFEPAHWTVLDAVAVSVNAIGGYADFTVQDKNLDLYRFLAEKYPDRCDDVFEQLLWTRDSYAVTTKADWKRLDETPDPMPAKGCRVTSGQMPNGLSGAAFKKVSAIRSEADREPKRASLVWAAGRDRARDANTIFVAGPQVGWHRPAFYFTVGMHGGDFDFIGLSGEGIPVFPVGFSRHYAWTVTAGLGIQPDLFALTLVENGAGYVRGNTEIPFDVRQEAIEIKGEPAQIVTFRTSAYGPVVEFDKDSGTSYAKSCHCLGYQLSSVLAWIKASATTSFDDWRMRMQNLSYNYNLFYADNTGQLGFAHTGRFPIRPDGADRRLPVNGDGSQDYQGYTAPDETLVYTTTDVIYNFNNRPTRDVPNSGLYWEQWSRGNQVEILKRGIDNWPARVDWDDVWNLNRTASETDVNFAPFRQIFGDAMSGLDQGSIQHDAAQAVVNWDGRRVDSDGNGYFDAVGLTVFDRWIENLVRRVLGPTFEGAKAAGAGEVAGYYLNYVHQRLPARLEEHPAGGTLAVLRAFLAANGAPEIHNRHDFFDGRTPTEVAREALNDTVVDLAKKFQSDNLAEWKTPATHQTYFPSNSDRTPMSVTSTNTDYGIYANRGSANLVVEYGEDGSIVRAGFVNPLGGPEERTADAPSTFHLDLYADQRLAPLDLTDEQTVINRGAVLIKQFQ